MTVWLSAQKHVQTRLKEKDVQHMADLMMKAARDLMEKNIQALVEEAWDDLRGE